MRSPDLDLWLVVTLDDLGKKSVIICLADQRSKIGLYLRWEVFQRQRGGQC